MADPDPTNPTNLANPEGAATPPPTPPVDDSLWVVGAGLAGSEAAFQASHAGLPVTLFEMRPTTMTPVHQSGNFAELVCSNSFRSDDADHSAIGLLHEELRKMGSVILEAADMTRIPAGSALAMDRDDFSAQVTQRLGEQANITVKHQQLPSLPPAGQQAILATGPLTSEALAHDLARETGEESLAFFDAIAPIVTLESVDLTVGWFQSRYDKGGGDDYLNLPLNQEQYEKLIADLIEADRVPFHEFEKSTPWFEGCLPIEVMAARGPETLRFGPMKPVGLRDPNTNQRPWAVVQLRRDNRLGTLWNLSGFQTKMRYGEQLRVLRTVPGLENAEFVRLGGIHRNMFLHSPKLLSEDLSLKTRPGLRIAGQLTGCEGYVESAAVGLLASWYTIAERAGETLEPPPLESMIGGLLAHITGGAVGDFQPMNANFGLVPEFVDPPGQKRLRGRDRRTARVDRGRLAFDAWLERLPTCIGFTRPKAA